MTNDGLYLRIQGKVSGPFDDPALRNLIKRGVLSRIHQVSRDRVHWESAGRVEGLFRPTVVVADQPTPTPETGPAEATPAGAPAAPMVDVFYEANGQQAGPVPVAVVASMAINGAISPDALVWTADDARRLPARDHPLLRDVDFPNSVESAGTNPRLRSKLSTVLLAASCVSLVAVGAYEANRLTAKHADATHTARPQLTPPAAAPPSAATPPPAAEPPSATPSPEASSTTPQTNATVGPSVSPPTPPTPSGPQRRRRKKKGPAQ